MPHTRTIEQGDTLSQIAVEEGVSIDEITQANDIQDPDQIEAGADLTIPDLDQAEEAAVDPSEPLLEEDDVPDVVSTEDFDLDISQLREENQQIRAGIEEELEPTTLERDLQRSILDVRERADEIELEQKENLLDLRESGVGTMAGLLAAEEALTERDALQLEALQREEANLLSRLGLEQDAREVRLATQDRLLEMNTQDQELAFRIQDRLEAQRERQRNREEELTSRQKANLNDMINLMSGVDPTAMDAETEARLAQLSRQANIPFSVVRDRLELEYNERIADASGFNETTDNIEQETVATFEDVLNSKESELGRELNESERDVLEQAYNQELADDPRKMAVLHRQSGFDRETTRGVLESNFPGENIDSILDEVYRDNRDTSQLSPLAREYMNNPSGVADRITTTKEEELLTEIYNAGLSIDFSETNNQTEDNRIENSYDN